MGKRYSQLHNTAKLNDLRKGNFGAIDTDNEGGKKLPLELIATKAEAYGMYRYTGTFSTSDALEIPITQEVGRKYRVSVDTTATSYSLYVYKSGQTGSSRSFTSAKEFEFLAEDLTAGRDCIRVYFNTASSDSATIDVFVRDGEAVELNGIVDAITTSDDGFRTHAGTFSQGDFYEFPISQKVGEKYEIVVTTSPSASFSRYVYRSGVANSGRSVPHKQIFEYTDADLSANRDCVRIYFNSGSNVSVTMTLYKLNSAGSLAYAPKSAEDDILQRDGFIAGSGTYSTGDSIEIPLPKKVGEKYVLEYTSTASSVSRYLFKSGTTGSGRSIKKDELITYTADDLTIGRNCVRIYFNTANSDTIEWTLYKINKRSLSTMEVKENRNAAFLGASYVTYEDWIPSGQTAYYPRAAIPDVDDVSKCWWYIALKELGWTLFKNDSWSGATISNSVRTGMPVSCSFVNRAEASYGSGRVLDPKPSAIFVQGGLNDTDLGTEVGACMYSGWTDADLLKVAPAFCKVLDTLTHYNVGARIIAISCNVSAAIHTAMEEACTHYGVQLIKVTGISGDYAINGHPNAAGHQKIADAVVAAVKDC